MCLFSSGWPLSPKEPSLRDCISHAGCNNFMPPKPRVKHHGGCRALAALGCWCEIRVSLRCVPFPSPFGEFGFAAGLSLMLSLWQDLRPLYAGRCQYYSKSTTPPEVRAAPAVPCQGPSCLERGQEPAPVSWRGWEAGPGVGAGCWSTRDWGSPCTAQ